MIRESWLTEISPDAPCGPDLEYDQDYLALERAAQGKAEQQYGATVIPAEEPVWADVVDRATAALERTRDVRIVHLLSRGLTHTQGLPGFASALQLTRDLLDRFWDPVHPRLVVDDEADPMMRMNALGAYAALDGTLRDVRAADLLRTPAITITMRDAENILDTTVAKSEDGLGVDQLRAAIGDALAADPAALPEPAAVVAAIDAIRTVLLQHLEPAMLPDFAPLVAVFKPVAAVVEDLRAQAAGGAAGVTAEGAAAGGALAVGELRSREDALRALDRVCDFLGRNEPTNPAPLLIRRAQRIMTMPFMDIIRELAPDATQQVQTITGAPAEQ